MRLVTYEIKTVMGRHARLGAWHDGHVADLNFGHAWLLASRGEARPYGLADALLPADMAGLLAGGDRAMAAARETLAALAAAGFAAIGPNEERLWHPIAEVRLLAPLPRPNSLRDFYAFEEHVKTGFAKRGEAIPAPWYQFPVYYKGNPCSMIGPEAEVPWPRYTRELDFELELAAVIGREGRNIPLERAHEYIAGYMVMNDFSARDIQRKEMMVRLGPAKGKDFATAIGPWLVTPDEVGDVRDLPTTVRVNGEVWATGNAGNPYWNFEQMIAHVSMDETLYPGDLLGSGTVGRGCGLELDRWLQPGDRIAIAIARVGELVNPIGQPIQAPLPVLRGPTAP